jgi:hypothetical protein
MIFFENPLPLFGIMLWKSGKSPCFRWVVAIGYRHAKAACPFGVERPPDDVFLSRLGTRD